ncbi:MAG: biotin--[acetyl-CoA-carboxylase] ligase [Bacteroides sp.]|nr:biotin--[acetyl-CoA-carboxylase] ligase [Bacteroides sp.]
MMPYPDGFSFPCIRVEETDSTSLYLARLCTEQEVKEMTVVTADHQTAGRGQRGNSWESEQGENLLFSTVLYPTFLSAKEQFRLSQVISLAVKETVDVYAEEFSVKWPNDIFWKEKKICGMLLENDLTGTQINRCIAGIGININQEEFHSPAPNPVSLRQITGKKEDLSEVLKQVMERISVYYELLKSDKGDWIAARYQRSLFRNTGFHDFQDQRGIFSAMITGIEPGGRLILTDDTGRERRYAFKEVSYLY